jgi:RNA polymerase sigma-70 factor (ECF subfamily)
MQNPSNALIRTRTTLIKRLRNWQDQASWQAFFDTYWKLIYHFALKSGLTRTEAEDVVQETMISVAKHMPSFNYDRNIGSFKAWLFSMTRWRITDQFRKRDPVCHSRSNSDSDSDSSPAAELCNIAGQTNLDTEALWDTEWKKALLEAATAKVKRSRDLKHYQIFDLFVNKEWAPAKIAKTFEITVAQVYLTKHRVVQAIKKEVERLQESIT